MDPQRGEAITREQTRMKKMLKAEKKEEGEEKKRKSRSKSRTPTPETTTLQASQPSSNPLKLGPFRTTNSWSFQDHHKFPKETPFKS